MWSLHDNEKELKPLIFSNGKSQADVVKEVYDSVGEGYKIIFIKGVCGSGKSAMALNLARKFGRASIVVPIKSLQEQYTKDYSEDKFVLKDRKDRETKLKIASIVGRNNFKCKYLEENKVKPFSFKQEKNLKLNDIFDKSPVQKAYDDNESCDNKGLPCKLELKERNLPLIKDYIKKNPDLNITDFESVKDIKRMSIAPVCKYWCPILPAEIDLKKFKDANKLRYRGLQDKEFVIYQRNKGCSFYDQYEAYSNADVIIFNSLKYQLESLMDRKPGTDIEIIDECDDFLDSFSNQERLSLGRLSYALETIFVEPGIQKEIDELVDISNSIKIASETLTEGETYELKKSRVGELIEKILDKPEIISAIQDDETNYLHKLNEVAQIFEDFLDETYYSIQKDDKDITIHIVTTNLAKRLDELIEKNKVIVMMSGTIHSENVLKNIFGLDKFKIVEAETKNLGELIKCKHGYEMDCSYANFQRGGVTREGYLKSLDKSILFAKKPALVHVNSFADLPNGQERERFGLYNLMTSQQLLDEQRKDPLGKRVQDFKDGKQKVLFTTKCNRGVDFAGETCNSIVITKFPYPNISSLFWKILKKTKPQYFMNFYMDKARRELLQKIYRGLRSEKDRVYLLSPDKRVMDFNIG